LNIKFNGENKNVCAKFIWKEKVNVGLNEGTIGKIRQQSTILVWEFYAKTTLKKEQRE
jgi:hypothetical protein